MDSSFSHPSLTAVQYKDDGEQEKSIGQVRAERSTHNSRVWNSAFAHPFFLQTCQQLYCKLLSCYSAFR